MKTAKIIITLMIYIVISYSVIQMGDKFNINLIDLFQSYIIMLFFIIPALIIIICSVRIMYALSGKILDLIIKVDPNYGKIR